MNRDEEFLIKRIKDLAEQSYRTGLYTYTGFLKQQCFPSVLMAVSGRYSGLAMRKVWDTMRAFLFAVLRSSR